MEHLNWCNIHKLAHNQGNFFFFTNVNLMFKWLQINKIKFRETQNAIYTKEVIKATLEAGTLKQAMDIPSCVFGPFSQLAL